jgi:hypothetical protein
LFPSEQINSNNSEYNEAKRILAEEKESFLNKLSGDTLEHFHRIADIYCQTETIYSYECFAHGFRLAVALIIDSISGKRWNGNANLVFKNQYVGFEFETSIFGKCMATNSNQVSTKAKED